MKRTLIVYGNCQAGVFYHGFQARPEVSDQWDLVTMRNFIHPVDGPDKLPPDEIERCAILLEQGGPEFPYADQLPDDCRVIRFPPLDTNLLWPLNFIDPRNKPEPPDFPFGRYPYGDRVVVELLNEGQKGEALWEAYQQRSIDRLPNLERLQTLEAARLAERDLKSDTPMAPIVLEQFALQRLFWTPNHPTGFLLGFLFGSLACALLGEDEGRRSQCLEYFMRWQPWSGATLPIHPEVARRLGLRWHKPEDEVPYNGRTLSFSEYMRSYIYWV